MFNEFEKEDDQWRPPQKKWWVITKKVIRTGIVVLCIAFIGFLILRMCTSQPPDEMTEIVWTDRAVSAYKKGKETGKPLKVMKVSSSDSFDKGDGDDDKTNDVGSAMTSIHATYYIPAVNELQFTVRFNNRLINYLEKDHPEARQLFEDGKEVYKYVITFEYNEEERTVTDYTYTCDEKAGYTYRRLVFFLGEDVQIEKVNLMTLEVYYVGDSDSIRHTMYVYKSSYGMLEQEYEAPDRNSTFTLSSPPTVAILLLIGVAALIIYAIFKTKLAIPLVLGAINALVSVPLGADFTVAAAVFTVSYAATLVPTVFLMLTEAKNAKE